MFIMLYVLHYVLTKYPGEIEQHFFAEGGAGGWAYPKKAHFPSWKLPPVGRSTHNRYKIKKKLAGYNHVKNYAGSTDHWITHPCYFVEVRKQFSAAAWSHTHDPRRGMMSEEKTRSQLEKESFIFPAISKSVSQ